MADKTRHDRGWRKLVRNFSPSWFTVNMGTGIVSILLWQFPYNARWLYWLSVIVFGLNVLLFGLATITSLLRYILWPEIWSVMIHHPSQALFVGAVPMGFATIIDMVIFVCIPAWGDWALYTAWGMWMADSILAMAIAFYMPFILIKQKEDTQLSSITALQLFPAVATVVSSSTGGLIAMDLQKHHPQQALATVIASYILWGLGMFPAMMIMTMYFQRLAIHKLPPREVVVSVFLPLGPPSLGSFAVVELGLVAMNVFPRTDTIHPLAGVILYSSGVLIALVMWGFALLWLFFAVATISHCKKFPFNMGWWGFTFPIGCFAILSNKLAIELPSRFFRVIGAVTSVCVFILWIVVSIGTIKEALSGKLFNTPDLKNLVKEGADQTDGLSKAV